MGFFKDVWDRQWDKWQKKGDYSISTFGKVLFGFFLLLVILYIIYTLYKSHSGTQSGTLDLMRGVQ